MSLQNAAKFAYKCEKADIFITETNPWIAHIKILMFELEFREKEPSRVLMAFTDKPELGKFGAKQWLPFSSFNIELKEIVITFSSL